jgi:hypothetical protein
MKCQSKKLDHRFYRPYPVMKRIGMNTYHLKFFQLAGRIYIIFYVSLLEQYVSDERTASAPPRPIEICDTED